MDGPNGTLLLDLYLIPKFEFDVFPKCILIKNFKYYNLEQGFSIGVESPLPQWGILVFQEGINQCTNFKSFKEHGFICWILLLFGNEKSYNA